MLIVSYHVKTRLKKIGKFLGILCIILLVLVIFRFFWLERYIVYTQDGLVFDFDRSTANLSGQGQEITPTEATNPIRIIFDDSGDTSDDLGLQPLSGYYADGTMLSGSLSQVNAYVQTLEPGTTVMLDVKSIYGNFYYSTGITDAAVSTSMDIAAIDELINYLDKSGMYLIARVPAFCDQAFGLNHVPAGLPLSSGALWMDGNGCYWLDPADTTVLNYLSAIVGDLLERGFDEVVFTDFTMPDNSNIVYDFGGQSKQDILKAAAENLINAFMGQRIVISFASSDPTFPIPSATSRLYLENVDAGAIEALASQATTLTDASLQLVFLTASRDTRFNEYNVLRVFPLAEEP